VEELGTDNLGANVDEISTPVFLRYALEAGFSKDELLQAEVDPDGELPSISSKEGDTCSARPSRLLQTLVWPAAKAEVFTGDDSR